MLLRIAVPVLAVDGTGAGEGCAVSGDALTPLGVDAPPDKGVDALPDKGVDASPGKDVDAPPDKGVGASPDKGVDAPALMLPLTKVPVPHRVKIPLVP